MIAMDLAEEVMAQKPVMVAIMTMMIIITHMVQVVMDKREEVMRVVDQDMVAKEIHMEPQMDIEQRNTIMVIVMVRKDMVLITIVVDILHQDMVMEMVCQMVCQMAIVMEEDHHIKCF
jgi:hypothetical protein